MTSTVYAVPLPGGTASVPGPIPEASKPEVVHDAWCDGCSERIRGVRHKCLDCNDFDFCDACRGREHFNGAHQFYALMQPGELIVRDASAPQPAALRARGRANLRPKIIPVPPPPPVVSNKERIRDKTAPKPDKGLRKHASLGKTSALPPPNTDADTVPTSAQSIQPNDVVTSAQMSSGEMFELLVNHGCADLSSHMDPDQYSSGLIVGGAFGDIWKGKLRDGTEVAIKMWRFCSLPQNGPKPLKRAIREIYYWSKAKHQNIQELMGVIMFQGRLGMVSLWMDHGNLREYIGKYPDVDRYSLCFQVATGVLYLHRRKMVHGDLKAANVLVSRDGVIKLSDFDHSIMVECSLAFSETSKSGGGTTRWMAPELLLEDNSCRNEHTDIYALGMTMLEIVTGSSPYHPECREDHHVIRAVMQERLPKRQTTYFGNNARENQMWELLLRCWSREPTVRPKAADVLVSLDVLIGLS